MKRKPLLILFNTVFLDLVGFGMIIPLIGLYGRHFGASGLELSLLGAAFSFFQLFFSSFWGALSDRIGRRPVLLISLLGSTLSYFGFALAQNFETLLLTRIFAGIFSGNISAAQAYIADVTAPEDRAKGMGLIGAAFGLGFTIGPALGGLSSYAYGLSAPGICAGTLCAINFLLAVFFLPESFPATKRRIKKPASSLSLKTGITRLFNVYRPAGEKERSLFVLLLASNFLFTFAFSNMEQTLSLYLQKKFEWPTELAGMRSGLLLMASGLVGAFTQGYLVRKLVHKVHEKKMIQMGFLFFGLGMILFAWGPEYWTYFLFTIPVSIGAGLISPSLSSLVSKTASPLEQGEALGNQQAFSSLARVLGPLSGLTLFQIYSPSPYILSAVIGLMVAWVWFNRQKKYGFVLIK